jgi:hypothetical protein
MIRKNENPKHLFLYGIVEPLLPKHCRSWLPNLEPPFLCQKAWGSTLALPLSRGVTLEKLLNLPEFSLKWKSYVALRRVKETKLENTPAIPGRSGGRGLGMA